MTTPTSHTQVAIIGGGMVGATLACVLGDMGIKTVIFEAFAHPSNHNDARFDDRTVALSYGSRLLLDKMGLWNDLRAHVQRISDIQISQRGYLGLTRISAREENIEALGYVIENRLLGQTLQAHLNTLPHHTITWKAPAVVTAIHTDNNSAKIDYTIDEDEQTHQVSADLIIGADGCHSFVREQLGIGITTHDYGLSAVVSNIQTQRAHNGRAFERFTSHGPLALLPLQDFDVKPRCSLVVTVPTAEVHTWQAYSDAEFITQIQKRFGYQLGRIEKTSNRSVYPVPLTQATQIYATRTLLIGNAAQCLNPVAGQGFNLALRDVASVAMALRDAALQPNIHDDIDYGNDAIIHAYVHTREHDRATTIAFTDRMIKIFAQDCSALAHVRSLGLLLTDGIEPTRQRIVQRGMGLLASQRIRLRLPHKQHLAHQPKSISS